MRLRLFFLLLMMTLLAACDSASPPPLPTSALDAQATAAALTPASTQEADVTPTPNFSGRPTLPPPPTATLSPTPTATEIILPTPTPQGFSSLGTIYYIYNNDSIAAVPADDSHPEELVVRFPGGRISDLSASPDGQYLVYVANGGGSAREVFVSSRDGTYTQQVSCLGFERVLSPVWQPNGDLIAFLASQTETSVLNIYVARLAGAGNCPADNGQALLVGLERPEQSAEGTVIVGGLNARELVWSSDGTRLFYNDDDLFMFTLESRTTRLLSEATGFGPEFGLAYSPRDELLYFLHSTRETTTDGLAEVWRVDVSRSAASAAPYKLSYTARYLHWSADGSFMVFTNDRAIYVYNSTTSGSSAFAPAPIYPPAPVFSPDAQNLAWAGVLPENPAVLQIFVSPRENFAPTQITAHTEGMISDLIWLPG